VANITVVTGLLLTVVGVVGYFGTGTSSFTALIPSGFGLVLILLGALARNERRRMHAMHAAVLVGLVGFVGCAVMAVPKLPTLLREGRVTRTVGDKTADATAAVLSQTVTGLLCAVFVALCVKSFVDARRARRNQPPAGGPPA
jgi:hypothetical protein